MRTGRIEVHRADVAAITEAGIKLSTGAEVEVDAIILATGYQQFAFPFLPADAVRDANTPEHAVDLWKLMLSTRYKNLFFNGLTELIGPLPPAAEAQARLTAALVSGVVKYPSDSEMKKDVERMRKHQRSTFVQTERHTLLQPYVPYVDEVLKPLGAVPSFTRMLGRCITGNPVTALKLLMAVYFGICAGAMWRMTGHGAKPEMAKATLLRLGGKNEKLSEEEVVLVEKSRVVREEGAVA